MNIKKYQQLATITNLESQYPGVLVPVSTAKSSNQISAQELHKYVGGLIGVFVLFLITFPVAMMRVSHHPKFAADRSHVKSLATTDRSSCTELK